MKHATGEKRNIKYPPIRASEIVLFIYIINTAATENIFLCKHNDTLEVNARSA